MELYPPKVFVTTNLVSNASLTSSMCDITSIFLKRSISAYRISTVALLSSSSSAPNPSSTINVSIFPLYPLLLALHRSIADAEKCLAPGTGP